MFMDYIAYQGVTQDVAEQMMLQDLERLFRKSHSIPIKCLHGILRVAIAGIRATFSKNNFSKTVETGISATSTTQSSSPQHPRQKIGNQMHVPSLLNPHTPLRLDLLKARSLPC